MAEIPDKYKSIPGLEVLWNKGRLEYEVLYRVNGISHATHFYEDNFVQSIENFMLWAHEYKDPGPSPKYLPPDVIAAQQEAWEPLLDKFREGALSLKDAEVLITLMGHKLKPEIPQTQPVTKKLYPNNHSRRRRGTDSGASSYLPLAAAALAISSCGDGG